jgi:hypothetical protein
MLLSRCDLNHDCDFVYKKIILLTTQTNYITDNTNKDKQTEKDEYDSVF